MGGVPFFASLGLGTQARLVHMVGQMLDGGVGRTAAQIDLVKARSPRALEFNDKRSQGVVTL